MKRMLIALCVATLFAANAQAEMLITEWMYSGNNGEFVEFTNFGTTAIDMAGWSYSDSDNQPGDVDLSAFGTIAIGESVILTEADAATFRTAWGLAASVKVIGGNTNSNLGRNDEIHLYDASNAQADSLVFGDQTYAGTIRTQNKSGNATSVSVLGANTVSGWALSANSDIYGSYASSAGDLANPGTCVYAITTPEPGTLVLLAAGLVGLLGYAWRKRS